MSVHDQRGLFLHVVMMSAEKLQRQHVSEDFFSNLAHRNDKFTIDSGICGICVKKVFVLGGVPYVGKGAL